MASVFSKIIAKEIPSYKIAEDNSFYAFLDINPLEEGHVLVVPKIEIDYIFDMEDELLSKFNIFAKKIALAIDKSIKCKRVGIAVIGLEVAHAHIHLIPLHNDAINFSNSKKSFSDSEFKEIALKISREVRL
jgi:histidine triad (HIT) family protein